MSNPLTRREFLGSVGAVAAASLPVRPLAQSVLNAAGASGPADAAGAARVPKPASAVSLALETFDYQGVTLRPSRWQKQYAAARDYYLGVPNDDILCGYRRAAGLAAPGAPLGGWCRVNSDTVFGQWIQAMARAARATGDGELGAKAVALVTELAKTVGPDGNCRMRHYPYEKLIGGLVDTERYLGFLEARPLLNAVIDWGIKNLDRTNLRAEPTDDMASGHPGEWYTMAENIYRAYELTGEKKYKEFGDAWLYPAYWDKLAETSDPVDAFGFHGYSHVNTFSSAAMHYAVTGDEKYLRIIKNAYDWLQNRQCWASGGFGPYERLMDSDGALGRVLERGTDSWENPCSTWAGFKLARYLMTFTGESRYGDWIEKLMYNGIGSALPIRDRGQSFYYDDYHIDNLVQRGPAKKVYYKSTYPCCSGTYFQDVVEYHNLVYFRDGKGLYVNLYVASEVVWKRGEDEIKLVQETDYPEAESSAIKLSLKRPVAFPMHFRVPTWAAGLAFKINGVAPGVTARPGAWATIDRTWQNGDNIEVTIPLQLRKVPVDRQHPRRVALMRGPVMLAQDAGGAAPGAIPDGDALQKWLVAGEGGIFRAAISTGGTSLGIFKPLYMYPEGAPYRVYFDPDFHNG